MTHRQQPLGSGFTPAATADEVLAGLDLTGKNVIVTGGNSGLGRESARALTRAGASVTVASRSVGHLDLMDPDSIDAFAAQWLETGRPLDILINNAGIPSSGQVVRDSRGSEAQFSTGHLGHFRLTLALRPALRAAGTAGGARVVNVSSGAHRFGEIRWDDPNFVHNYHPGAAYAQTKRANVLFAVELDRRWAADGIRGYAVHPGVVVGTTLNNAAGRESLLAQGLIDETGRPVIDPVAGKKTPPQGAGTIVFAAASPLINGLGGVYLKDNDIAVLDDTVRPLTPDSIPSDATSASLDPESARRLWELSEALGVVDRAR